MYKKILCAITAFILCTNIVFAHPKDSIQDLDSISNSLNTVYLSMLQNKDIESLKKEIDFISSQISSQQKKIRSELASHKDRDKVGYLALLSVLNYFEISILEIKNYYENNNNKSFINAISALNEADSVLSTIKSGLLKNTY